MLGDAQEQPECDANCNEFLGEVIPATTVNILNFLACV